MKRTLLLPIDYDDFFSLSKGDTVFIKVYDEMLKSEVLDKPFYNIDADEPDWEVETSNGFSDMYSIYIQRDTAKYAPEGLEIGGILFKHNDETYDLWKDIPFCEEDMAVLWSIFSKYETEGSSFSGTLEEVAEDLCNPSEKLQR